MTPRWYVAPDAVVDMARVVSCVWKIVGTGRILVVGLDPSGWVTMPESVGVDFIATLKEQGFREYEQPSEEAI